MTPIDQSKFDRIVAHARATNPFYAEWIKGPSDVPILPRRVFLENNDRILNGHPITAYTSGSTGMPVRLFAGGERSRMDAADTFRLVQSLGGPRPAVQIVTPRRDQAPASLINVKTSPDEQVDFILSAREKRKVSAIITFPTNAAPLADRVIERDVDMRFIDRFGLMSETVEPWHRERVRAAFPNARIWTTYSATEVGMISCTCPHHEEYQHLMTHKLRVEVVDDDGRPCPHGRIGRVVITDYFNFECPFIRYDIGDLAETGICPCGKTDSPAFTRVLGKVRGALKHRDGRRVFFSDLSSSLFHIEGMKQFQVIQESLDEITVRIVIDRNVDEDVRAAVTKHFGYEPRVTTEYLAQIPRDPNGKFYASICRI